MYLVLYNNLPPTTITLTFKKIKLSYRLRPSIYNVNYAVYTRVHGAKRRQLHHHYAEVFCKTRLCRSLKYIMQNYGLYLI